MQIRDRPEVAPQVSPSAPRGEDDLSSGRLAYSIKEAVRALGISRTTIYHAIARGEISAVKLGGRTLLPAASLKAWLNSPPVASD